MKYAVIRLGGKQFKLNEGDTFQVERQETPVKADVLVYSDGETTLVGAPVLTDVTATITVIEEKRDKKVMVSRFKSKSRYDKTNGHRQPISILKLEKIEKVTKAPKASKKLQEEKEA